MSANDIQVGGSHYKTGNVQHWDFIEAYGIGYLEGYASRYLMRQKVDGKEDMEKGLHCIRKLRELHNEGARYQRGDCSHHDACEWVGSLGIENVDQAQGLILLLTWKDDLDLAKAEGCIASAIIQRWPN